MNHQSLVDIESPVDGIASGFEDASHAKGGTGLSFCTI